MPAIISDAVEIQDEHLKTSLFFQVKKVSGVSMFVVKKADHKIERLLCPPSTDNHNTRKITNTTIIETITKLRDNYFWSKLGIKRNARSKRRYTADDVAVAITLEDELVTLTLPQIGDIPQFDMRVLLTKPGGGNLQIEMSHEVIEYLSAVVKYQIDSGGKGRRDSRKSKRDDISDCSHIPGVSMLYGMNAVRAKKKLHNGRFKTKTLKIDDKTTMQMAIEQAEMFVNGTEYEGDNGGDAEHSADDVASQDSDHVVGDGEDDRSCDVADSSDSVGHA